MGDRARTVLIVDPTEAGERLAQRCSDHGLNTLLARSAEQALDLIIEEAPEVAVVEMDLPDAPGTDLAVILTGDTKIPLFMASSARLPADDDEIESIMLGVAGLFAKPYQTEAVIAELARALGAELEELRQSAAISVEAEGKRWGHEDVTDEEPALSLEDVVDADENGAREAVDQEELDGAAEAAAEESPEALDLVEVWERKVAAYREEEKPARPELGARAGRIEDTPVDELFDLFYQTRRSGELGLVRGKAKRLVVFHEGHPVYARSNIARERLGTNFVEVGLVTDAQLREALLEAGGSDQRVGDVLVQRELLTDANRRKVLRRVVSQIVMSCFAWREGEYHIGLVERARTEPVTIPLYAGNVILRGLALTTSLEKLREAIPDDARFAPVPDPPYPMERLRLTGPEAHLLISADGTKTVSDLSALIELHEQKLRALLYGLQRLQVIELVGRGQAKPRAISFF